MDNAVVLDVGIFVQSEDHTIAKLLFVRAQRADEVTEALGQHGNSTVDEIDAGGSFRRLLVYDRTFLDIMRDVGNMHTDLVKLLAVSFWLLAHGLFANCQLPIANSPY